MESKIGYRVRIRALIGEEGSYLFRDDFFESYESAYLLYNYITLDGVRDALNAPDKVVEAFITLDVIDANGFIADFKKHKAKLLKRKSH